MENDNNPKGTGTIFDLGDTLLGEGWARSIADDILAAPEGALFTDIPPPLIALHIATANATARTQMDNARHVLIETVNDLEEARREYWREYLELKAVYGRIGSHERPAPSAIFRRLFMAKCLTALIDYLETGKAVKRRDAKTSLGLMAVPTGATISQSKSAHFEQILKEFLGQEDNAGGSMPWYKRIAKEVLDTTGIKLEPKTLTGYYSKWRGGKPWITKELTGRIISELEDEGRPIDYTYLAAINPI